MNGLIKGKRGLLAAITIIGLIFGLVGYSDAGYKETIFGVAVSYSKNGAIAYYDSDDGTLTVAVVEDGGNLKITFGPDAPGWWGSYVDVYILADNAYLNTIQIKGSTVCLPFIVGKVGYVKQFKLINGVVGGADSYPTLGLGRVSDYFPSKIMLQNAVTFQQLLGYEYVPQVTGVEAESRLSAKQSIIRTLINDTQDADDNPVDE